MERLILNSMGLDTKKGSLQIYNEVKHSNIAQKKIFIVSYSPYGVDERIIYNCIHILGFQKENIFMSVDGIPQITPDYVYVTAGNTFEVLHYMRQNNMVDYIKSLMEHGTTTYIGSSAGAMIAGSDIMLAGDFDNNFVGMVNFDSLNLFDGTIIPHYEPDELERYITNTEQHILNRYNCILSVSNENVLVIEN